MAELSRYTLKIMDGFRTVLRKPFTSKWKAIKAAEKLIKEGEQRNILITHCGRLKAQYSGGVRVPGGDDV